MKNQHFQMKIFIHLHSMFHSLTSRVKINSTNWPAPNVSANAEAMGSNPVEAPNFFFFFFGGGGVNLQLLNCNYHWDDHIFIENCISTVHIIFILRTHIVMKNLHRGQSCSCKTTDCQPPC